MCLGSWVVTAFPYTDPPAGDEEEEELCVPPAVMLSAEKAGMLGPPQRD